MSEPDLTTYRAIHRQQRIDGARLVRAIEVAVDGDRSVYRPLARWTAGFGHELHTHHTVEDAVFFPAIAEHVPSAGELVAGLDADHDRVAELVERLAPAVAALADPRTPFAAAKATALEVAAGLHDLLAVHLDVEDQDLLPLFTRHMTGEEYEELATRANRSLQLRALPFAVPWTVLALPAEAREQLIGTAPLGLRIVWHLTHRRHARLVAAAFAGVAVPEPPALVSLPEVAPCG